MKIEKNLLTDLSLTSLPGWSTILGLQLESLVLKNRKALWEILHINPIEIVNDNPYLQRKTNNRPGCQIDYLIQTKFNILYVCEIKLTGNKIGSKVIHDVKSKLTRFQRQQKFACKPVLIYAGELTSEVIDSGFFAHVIHLSDLLT